MMAEEGQVYLGIGSNLGDKVTHIRRAVGLLACRVGKVLAVSEDYLSEPWGFESDNLFVNVAVQMATALSPLELLYETQDIERLMGRTSKSSGTYADRVIDIDILFYGQKVVELPMLKIPHPLFAERDFAVLPMAAIAPNFIHPTLHLTMKQIAARRL